MDVAVFKQNGTDLELAGGVFTNGGPLVCTKLYVPNTGRVRTHFERLLSTTQIQKLSEAAEEKRNEAPAERVSSPTETHNLEEGLQLKATEPPPPPYAGERKRRRLSIKQAP